MHNLGLNLKQEIMNLINDGNWNILKGKLKMKYGDLTDNELAKSEGEEDQVIGILQEKLGKTKIEIIDELKTLLSDN
ncbi:MAG: hypothetical protein ACJAVY_001780 [Marinoscillum sp.]|jgi:uncharacterized protein YjbJ (UPF0337 family)